MLHAVKETCKAKIQRLYLKGLTEIVSDATERNGAKKAKFFVEPDPEDRRAPYLTDPTATSVDAQIEAALKIDC